MESLKASIGDLFNLHVRTNVKHIVFEELLNQLQPTFEKGAIMSKNNINKFPPEVVNNIQHYVYRLIDPRNGETFYVGRGIGNRVFDHAQGEIQEDSLSEKMARIREIHLAGFNVDHVIHRHGMNLPTAKEVEAALIDAYPGLTNIANGYGSNDFGCMHAKEIIKRYCAETAVFRHKAILISVNRSALESSLYEAVRYAWRLNRKKAKSAEAVLPTVRGIIVGAFIADEWLEATTENFPGKEDSPGRYGFNGGYAPEEIKSLYVGKRVPDEYRKKGASNPIRYTW